jgi:hypothetical protein
MAKIPCFVCDGTGVVCKKHPERPFTGKYACACGAASEPCPACSGKRASKRSPLSVALDLPKGSRDP